MREKKVERAHSRKATTGVYTTMNLPNSLVGLVHTNIGMQIGTANDSTYDRASHNTNPTDGMTRCQVRFTNLILVTIDYVKPAYRPKRADERTSAGCNNEKNHRDNNSESVPRTIKLPRNAIIP